MGVLGGPWLISCKLLRLKAQEKQVHDSWLTPGTLHQGMRVGVGLQPRPAHSNKPPALVSPHPLPAPRQSPGAELCHRHSTMRFGELRVRGKVGWNCHQIPVYNSLHPFPRENWKQARGEAMTALGRKGLGSSTNQEQMEGVQAAPTPRKDQNRWNNEINGPSLGTAWQYRQDHVQQMPRGPAQRVPSPCPRQKWQRGPVLTGQEGWAPTTGLWRLEILRGASWLRKVLS